jgi:hypothetical protein
VIVELLIGSKMPCPGIRYFSILSKENLDTTNNFILSTYFTWKSITFDFHTNSFCLELAGELEELFNDH